MSVYGLTIRGTDYVLVKVGGCYVNGRKCAEYEVREVLECGAYHQLRNIHVPRARKLNEYFRKIVDCWDGLDGLDDMDGFQDAA